MRFGSVAVAGLLESEGPERRQRRRSGEIGVALHDLFRRGAVEEVVVERSAFGAEHDRVPRLLAEIEPRAPGVVEEEAVTARAIDAEEERDRLVERVGRFLRADVGVPQREGLVAAVEGSSFVAEAEVVFASRHLLGDGEAAELEADGPAHGVGGDDVAGEIADDETQRIALDADFDRGGAEADGSIVLNRLDVDRLGARGR